MAMMPSIRVREAESFCLRRLVISSVMRESLSILKATDSHCPSVVSAVSSPDGLYAVPFLKYGCSTDQAPAKASLANSSSLPSADAV